MEYWESFQNFAYAREVLIGVGALLIFFGIVKILTSSLKMVFWVLLATLGGASAAYGLNDMSFDFSDSEQPSDLMDYLESGKQLSGDVLQKLCDSAEPPK